MTAPSPAYIKGLFYQLVAKVGGVEAAGAYLGVSHQRVSQLQNMSCPDMPTLMHVTTLERVVGQPIVTGALARLVGGQAGEAEVETEIGDVTIATAEVLTLHRGGADKRQVKAAALKLVKEATEVADACGGDAA